MVRHKVCIAKLYTGEIIILSSFLTLATVNVVAQWDARLTRNLEV